MKFKVYPELFEKMPDACFGVVVGYGIDNKIKNSEIEEMLGDEMKSLRERLEGQNLKEYEYIVPYRDAFRGLGINPNKFMSSIEAMAKRIVKGSNLPAINPVVDLVNALSLKYVLPMGAHDIDALEDEIAVRFSVEGDTFIPLGSDEMENVEAGELVYADSKRIRTRRWIWRQSNRGRITDDSKNIFFPIDGFSSKNKENVLAAMELLANTLEQQFNCTTKKLFVDKDNNEVEI
ncbi:phenylalanine--tRNA ligase beta subunit-related protein [Wukongibacter baidiensis]|uniref:B3/B4 domain-containing protein n=1 Tax=Wukongibacter baidiensis TaxID=1723361 RepID=UPI003D7F4E3E